LSLENIDISSSIDIFLKRLQDYLNRDESIKRRLKPFTTFCGGPTPYPGPGPYPPPNLAMDPTGWSKAKGYSVSKLPGREAIEIEVLDRFIFTISIDKSGNFVVEMRKAFNPCLSVKMPIDVFKDMVLGRERVVYALADKRNDIKYDGDIGLSDWITIFGILGKMQELVESDPHIWKLIEELV